MGKLLIREIVEVKFSIFGFLQLLLL